jgi:hypothetical protein
MLEHDEHDHCNQTHPKDRAPKPDDPMEISAISLDGDPHFMLECIVEEYARMGCDRDQIVQMFSDPFYQGPYGLTRALGRERIVQRIDEILLRCGVLKFRMIEQAELENVVHITVRGREEGTRHAQGL